MEDIEAIKRAAIIDELSGLLVGGIGASVHQIPHIAHLVRGSDGVHRIDYLCYPHELSAILRKRLDELRNGMPIRGMAYEDREEPERLARRLRDAKREIDLCLESVERGRKEA